MAFKTPKLFAAGTKAKADDVNENFAAIEDEINNALAPGLFESGDLKPTARANPPTGWLLCDGSAVSRVTYKALFDAIGTAFGVGDGATTFNVPDLRGRAAVGVDGAAGRLTAKDALGNSGGEEKHDLTEAEIGFESAVGFGGGVQNGARTIGVAFNATPHNNMQPYQIVNWLVKI